VRAMAVHLLLPDKEVHKWAPPVRRRSMRCASR
jgi:hypothetical protein